MLYGHLELMDIGVGKKIIFQWTIYGAEDVLRDLSR